MLARENACKRNFLRFPVGEAPAQATAAVCDRRRPWLSATDACRLRPCRTPVAAIGALWRQLATVVGADGWRRQSPPTVAADSRRRQSPPTVAAGSRRRQSPPTVRLFAIFMLTSQRPNRMGVSAGLHHRRFHACARRLSAATVGGDCQQRGLWPAAYPVGRHPPPTTVVAANHLGRLLTPVSGVYCRRIWPTGSVDSIHRRQQLGAVAARRGGKRLERLEVAQHFFWRTGC